VCFDILHHFSMKHLILGRNEQDTKKKVYWSSCQLPITLIRFFTELEFSRQIFEKCSNIKFQENPPGGSQVVSCRWRDMTRLIVNFQNFANVPKNHFYSNKWHVPIQKLKSYNYFVLPYVEIKSLLILKQQLIISFTESSIQNNWTAQLMKLSYLLSLGAAARFQN
jgi:hypothetical protein